ncbi:MAG: hypothetical protein RIE52_12090 [Balneola sp.]
MIHKTENGSAKDIQRLEDKEPTQVELIKMILKNHGQPMAFFEVVKLTGFHQDSVKRALTNLTKHKDYRDQYGNFFAIFDSKIRKDNPSGSSCGTYRFNPDYGKPISVRKDGQSSMFNNYGGTN